MNPRFLTISILSACLAGSATAATNWIGTATDNITDAANWDNGLPAAGNQGTLAGDAAWDVSSAPDEDLVGWDLVMTGGTLTDNSTGYTRNEIYGGTTIDVQTGATWNRAKPVRLHGGAVVSVSGGTLNWNGIAAVGTDPGGFTLNVSGGTVAMEKLINFNNGTENSFINVSGGTVTMGVSGSDTRIIDEPNTFFTVSSGSLILNALNMDAADNNITMTVTGGSLTTNAYNPNSTDGLADQRYVNFPAGSTGTWTLTGADQTTFEGFWANDTLLYDGAGGSGGAAFGDVFQVTGSTLSLVPEPAASAFALLGLLLLARRRR